MLEKQENPLTIGKFGRAFKEYFDQEVIKTDGKTSRVWLNIDLKEPKQANFSDYDTS